MLGDDKRVQGMGAVGGFLAESKAAGDQLLAGEVELEVGRALARNAKPMDSWLAPSFPPNQRVFTCGLTDYSY